MSTFAAGVLLDPAYGVGGAVAARWPDAFRRQVVVGVTAGLATHGGYGALQVDVPTPWSLHLRARGHRARWWDPDAGAWAPASAGRVAVEVGPPLGDAFSARVGPVLRWDADLGGDPRPGHGLTAAVGWSTMRVWREPRGGRPGQRGGLSLGVRAETTLPGVSDYDGVVGVFQGVLLTPVADGELATRSYVQAAWGPSLPTTRTPFLGGPTLLRGAAFGDVRDDVVVLQSVELRHPVWRWLGLAVFGDVGAAVAKAPVVVPGGGVGLRVLPPPALGETVRLDVGVTPRGWQAYAGWGEAF